MERKKEATRILLEDCLLYTSGVMSLGKAKVGDKTFLDGIVPAVEAMNAAKEAGKDVKLSLIHI